VVVSFPCSWFRAGSEEAYLWLIIYEFYEKCRAGLCFHANQSKATDMGHTPVASSVCVEEFLASFTDSADTFGNSF
jgi:hypothetical protein